MRWNWERPDWPRFTWQVPRLIHAEEQFLVGAGVLKGTVRHLNQTDADRVIVEAVSSEALRTSEIEGEVLGRDSVQSSVRRRLGLASDSRRATPSEDGIAEMMVDLYRNFAAPLSRETLFSWHKMIFKGRHLRDMGCYRTHAEPMQVVSGSIYDPKVHLEAPPSSAVSREMTRFINWFNRTAPGGPEPLPALTRAGAAHLYFESIHPFEDGNGRLGRAISEKAIAQCLGRPSLTALSATVMIRRRSYYEALEAANKKNEITDWLAWFAGTAIEAQRRAIAEVEFLIDKTRLFDRLRGRLNSRQEAVLHRVLQEGPSGFKGGLSAGKYVSIAKTSAATATRDLADLVEKGGLTKSGELRHARYHPAIPLRSITPVHINANGEVVSS